MKWEYTIKHLDWQMPTESLRVLNELGDEGWEVVLWAPYLDKPMPSMPKDPEFMWVGFLMKRRKPD